MVSLAPSWAETTLQWISENHPQYISRARGTTPAERLANSLEKMSYLLSEHGGNRKLQHVAIQERVGKWDFNYHSDLREWLAKGGYKVPAHIAAAAAAAAAASAKAATLPPFVIDTPNGPEAIELVMPDEPAPARAPARDQSMDDVLADADERYGAW